MGNRLCKFWWRIEWSSTLHKQFHLQSKNFGSCKNQGEYYYTGWVYANSNLALKKKPLDHFWLCPQIQGTLLICILIPRKPSLPIKFILNQRTAWTSGQVHLKPHVSLKRQHFWLSGENTGLCRLEGCVL